MTFLIACLAIAGVPGLSGFFSKDEIIWMAFANGHTAVGVVAMIAAGMTAFYMFRLLYMTFFGEWRGRRDQEDHLKESPKSMTFPLSVLAVLSVIGGWIMIPKALGGGMQFEHFLYPVFEFANSLGDHAHHSISAEYTVMAISILIAIGGILLARSWYLKNPEIPVRLAARMKLAHKVLMNKYWVDEIYDFAVVQMVLAFGEAAWLYIDVKVVDGLVNGAGKLFDGLGSVVRRIQTGMVAHYALMMAMSIVFILGYMVWK